MAKSTTARKTQGKPVVNKQWFVGLLSDKRMSQRQFAAALGTDPSAISRMLDGSQHWRPAQCEAAAMALGVPLADVLKHLGIDSHAGAQDKVPVIGWVNHQGVVTLGRPAHVPASVSGPAGLPTDAVALVYRTAGTLSSFRNGWVIYYVPRHDVPADAMDRLCVAETADHQMLVGVLGRGMVEGTFSLVGPRGDVAPVESVRLANASPILWHKLV